MEGGSSAGAGNLRDDLKAARCVNTCRTGPRAHKHGSLPFSAGEVWAEITVAGGDGLGDGGGSQGFLSCPTFGEDNDPLSGDAGGHTRMCERANGNTHTQQPAMYVAMWV